MKPIIACFGVSVRNFESKILIKDLTNFEKNRKLTFSYEERYTYCYLKKQNKGICHSTSFYSIFNMSSCRKPEIHNDLPKITKIK